MNPSPMDWRQKITGSGLTLSLLAWSFGALLLGLGNAFIGPVDTEFSGLHGASLSSTALDRESADQHSMRVHTEQLQPSITRISAAMERTLMARPPISKQPITRRPVHCRPTVYFVSMGCHPPLFHPWIFTAHLFLAQPTAKGLKRLALAFALVI